jgi:Trypsin
MAEQLQLKVARFGTSLLTRLRASLFCAATALTLSSCGISSSDSASQGTIQQAIAGGQVDADEKWLGVVYVRTKVGQQTQLCSGTLIAPNIVVSAMHCVAPLDDGNFQCDYEGNVIQEHPGAGELGHPVEAGLVEIRVGVDAVSSEVAAHGKQLFTTNSANICTNDLAFIVLDTELDLPLAAVRLTQETTLGEALTIVGYGRTEGTHDATVRRYREKVRVTDLGTDDASNPLSAAPPRTLVVGPSACEGDSGGPAFAANKSGFGDPEQIVIAGVNSIAVGVCGANDARSVFTRLDPFKSLLGEVFTAAGQTIWEEGQTVPGEKLPDPEPEPTTTTSPEPEEPDTSKPRRLTTGCTAQPTPSDYRYHWLGLLLTAGYLVCARRKTTPISRR